MTERQDFWGKYIEIKLKNGGKARGLVIAQAGDSISISDEFKNLKEYQNYKPQIMGSCGIVYPHTEGYDWKEIDEIEVLSTQ